MTESQKKWGVGLGIIASIGFIGYFTKDKWMPFLFPDERNTESSSTTEVNNTTTPAPPASGMPTEEKPKILNVYSKYKGTGVSLSVAGTTTANPIVQGNKIRVTENQGENIGQFIKYVTIFAVPFVLFKESYSGRNALVAKTAVTVK